MSKTAVPSLTTIPLELVYRILDKMTPEDIMISLRGVCQRLNDVTDTYSPYKVNLSVPCDRPFLRSLVSQWYWNFFPMKLT